MQRLRSNSREKIKKLYGFCRLTDLHQAVQTTAVITISVHVYGIWLPLKHHDGLVLPTRDQLLGVAQLSLIFLVYLSSAFLLFYGNAARISSFYVPWLFVHSANVTNDLISSGKSLSWTLYYFRLSLSDKTITEIIYFPNKIAWSYKHTAYEHSRQVAFLLVEILVRLYLIRVVWLGYCLLQSEKRSPATDRRPFSVDCESGGGSSPTTQEKQLMSEDEVPNV